LPRFLPRDFFLSIFFSPVFPPPLSTSKFCVLFFPIGFFRIVFRFQHPSFLTLATPFFWLPRSLSSFREGKCIYFRPFPGLELPLSTNFPSKEDLIESLPLFSPGFPPFFLNVSPNTPLFFPSRSLEKKVRFFVRFETPLFQMQIVFYSPYYRNLLLLRSYPLSFNFD